MPALAGVAGSTACFTRFGPLLGSRSLPLGLHVCLGYPEIALLLAVVPRVESRGLGCSISFAGHLSHVEFLTRGTNLINYAKFKQQCYLANMFLHNGGKCSFYSQLRVNHNAQSSVSKI